MQGTLIQTFGTLLFCAAFLFLWRKSGVAYFKFWSLAWAVESLSLILILAGPCPWLGQGIGLAILLWLRVVLDAAFALALLFAAQSASSLAAQGFRSWPRSLFLPAVVLLVYATALVFGLGPRVYAAELVLIYAYSFFSIGLRTSSKHSVGGLMLRLSLAWLSCLQLGPATGALAGSVWEFVAQGLLVFSGLAMWIQIQQDSIVQLRTELDSLEKTAAGSSELDHLTGLQNRLALERYLGEDFTGVVTVCDLDYFKEINDRFGHLVGDEVLRSVGHLIRKSIRAEDEAFRWGGDEFVVLFRNQHLDIAMGRMAALEVRLTAYRIRGYGLFPLGLSWGAAEGVERKLQPILEEADLQMYEFKRRTHARKR